MELRIATEDDLAGMLVISNWAIENTSANFNTSPEALDDWVDAWSRTREAYPWLVAIDGQEVTGFAKASAYKGRCAYQWTPEVTVYVHPDHHGEGIGKRVYRALIDTLRAQGYNTAVGAISLPNRASEALHERLGFRRIGSLTRAAWNSIHRDD